MSEQVPQKKSKKIPSSQRLQIIEEFLVSNKPVWDMCCDHGLIGLSSYEKMNFPEVHFVDKVPSIIQKLKNNFAAYCANINNLTEVNFYELGAESLHVAVYGSVVIAGVGANTIIKIIESLVARKKLYAVRLILAPQNHLDQVEDYMRNSLQDQFQIYEKRNCMEKHRRREIVVYQRKDP